jgi:hypothetical protein
MMSVETAHSERASGNSLNTNRIRHPGMDAIWLVATRLFYFPLGTSALLSLIAALVFWLTHK